MRLRAISQASAPLLVSALLTLALGGCEDSTTTVESPTPVVPERLEIISGQNLVGAVGTRSSEPISVRVVSGDGIPIEGTRVVFTVPEGGATVDNEVVETDPAGVAFNFVNFGTTAGTVNVQASVPGLDGSPANFELMAMAAGASQILRISGDGQTGTVATALGDSIVARVVDAYGNAVVGVEVGFAPTPGDGSVSASPVVTDESGRVATTWTLGETAGTQSLQPSVDSSGGFPVSFHATAVAAAPSAIEIVSGENQGGAVGEVLSDPLVAKVVDAYGNAVSGVTVDFVVSSGDATADPMQATTDGSGRASTTVTLGSTGTHEIEARVTGLTAAAFSSKAFPSLTLLAPTKTLQTTELQWEGTTSADFQRFELRRSTISPVTAESELVLSSIDAGLRAFSDADVTIGTRYFYRIFVVYDGGYVLGSNTESVVAGVSVELGGVGADMVLDPARERMYVSMSSLNAVAILSTETYEVLDEVFVGSTPMGMDLSLDGQRLFVALRGAGAVSVLDLTSFEAEEILLGTQLGDDRAHDVLNPKPDVLVVTSNPGSNGFAYVVRVDLDFVDGHTAERIAGNRIIRAAPALGMGPNGDFVYVGESFSPNSLYKIDMNASGNPIVLEDDHGSVSGATLFDVSPDGARLYTSTGQVLRTASFNQAGTLTGGVPVVSGDGSLCYMGTQDLIRVFDTSTFLEVDQFGVPGRPDRMVLLDDESGMFVLVDDLVYGVSF